MGEEMEEKRSTELSSFLASGVYPLDGSSVVFMDPVRVLNESYTRFRLFPHAYYSRSFETPSRIGDGEEDASPKKNKKKKRKRKSKPPRELNEREKAAEKRHQEARPFLVRAHEALLGAKELLSILPDLVKGEDFLLGVRGEEQNFIKLGGCWRAPHYEMSLCFVPNKEEGFFCEAEDLFCSKGPCCGCHGERKSVPVFNNLISNETSDDIEAEFLNSVYILPRRSCFHMSDLRQIRNLIPVHSDYGYNLIVIDPPWENGSIYQKVLYPMLPNRHFLYLPVKQLAHTEGALVVLWLTNREKLRRFVEEELFPAWEVKNITCFYWVKVKPDGSLISEMDLFHHRPYECFLLGYIKGKTIDSECMPIHKHMQSNRVLISIPGSHSRKPPLDYIPGPKPTRCIELFARELLAGWTSWGNEPLHFQDSRYFMKKEDAR